MPWGLKIGDAEGQQSMCSNMILGIRSECIHNFTLNWFSTLSSLLECLLGKLPALTTYMYLQISISADTFVGNGCNNWQLIKR